MGIIIDTSTELANIALAHIGHATIDDISDTTEAAQYCNTFHPIARKMYIKQAKPHITRKEQTLSLATGETSNIYEYVYHKPSDVLEMIKIWEGDTIGAKRIKYEENKHSTDTTTVIKTDEQDAVLIYCTDITNLAVYRADDIMAISYLLAAFIAMPLKRDERITAFVESKYLIALKEAIKNDRNTQAKDIINIKQFNAIKNSRT